MTDKQYDYDPDLPYVVAGLGDGRTYARFRGKEFAEEYVEGYSGFKIIDTTPAPRVPEDAQIIMYPGILPARYFAFRSGVEWGDLFGEFHDTLEDLPGVTPETVFTVLEERKSDAGV